MNLTTQTTCPYCGVGCGVLVTALAEGRHEVMGDPDHPANLGRLCSKGAALGETLGLDGRLLHPEIGGERVTWDTALDEVANRFRAVIAEEVAAGKDLDAILAGDATAAIDADWGEKMFPSAMFRQMVYRSLTEN